MKTNQFVNHKFLHNKNIIDKCSETDFLKTSKIIYNYADSPKENSLQCGPWNQSN